jgi:hypothetical protein
VKIIFDENVPLPLRQFFPAHEVTTVQAEGWAGVENGAILERVEGVFDVLLLADKNLSYQQNLSHRIIALVELPTNRWPALQALAPKIVQAGESALPGSYTVVES